MLLVQGMKNSSVKELQENLIKLGYNCGEYGADGEFGKDTYKAVVAFQRDFGLEDDGQAGPITLSEISKALNNNSKVTIKKQIAPHLEKPLTGLTAERLIKIATAEIGYKEKISNSNLDSQSANAGSGNFTKYARDLALAGYYNGNKNGYAWCDVFVDWCFYQLANRDANKAQQLECQSGPLGAGCQESANYYKQAGRWSTTPQIGAQVFFQQGGICHTGIVESINGNKITTIEGNTSDMVNRRTYTIGDGYIAGYGLPIFGEEEEENNEDILYYAKIKAKRLNVRKNPNQLAPVVATINRDEVYSIIAEQNNWGKLKSNMGYIYLPYVEKIYQK